MLWAGLVAFALALVTYIAFEPSIWTLLTGAAELFGVVALFFLAPVRTPRLERDFGRLWLTSSASWAGFFGLVRSVRRGLVGTAAVASPVPARTLPRIAWAGRRVRQRIVRVGLRTWRRLTGVAHVNSP